MSNEYVLRLTVRRIIPVGLAIGAGMETFMYYTGFWATATRKEAEREEEARRAREEARKARGVRAERLHGALGLQTQPDRSSSKSEQQ